MAATAALVSQFPELHNLSAEQVPVAIKTVAQSNPERAQAMVRHIEGTQNLIAEAQRVQAAQMLQGYQQAAQQQFSAWAKQCDDAYENWASKEVSAAERKLIEAEARQMVADEYGASQE